MYILSTVSKGKLNLLRESVKDKSQRGSIKKKSIYTSATAGYLWCGLIFRVFFKRKSTGCTKQIKFIILLYIWKMWLMLQYKT